MSLPGPSRTITVEPIEAPAERPAPVEAPPAEPAAVPPKPDREPVPA